MDQKKRTLRPLNDALSASAGRVCRLPTNNDRLHQFIKQEAPEDPISEVTAKTVSAARNGCWRRLVMAPRPCVRSTAGKCLPMKPSPQIASQRPVRRAEDTSVGTSVQRAPSATALTDSASKHCPRWWLTPTASSGDWIVSKFYGIIRCHQRQVLHQEI